MSLVCLGWLTRGRTLFLQAPVTRYTLQEKTTNACAGPQVSMTLSTLNRDRILSAIYGAVLYRCFRIVGDSIKDEKRLPPPLKRFRNDVRPMWVALHVHLFFVSCAIVYKHAV